MGRCGEGKAPPRNHQAEHLSGVQQTLGARLIIQPSPFPVYYAFAALASPIRLAPAAWRLRLITDREVRSG